MGRKPAKIKKHIQIESFDPEGDVTYIIEVLKGTAEENKQYESLYIESDTITEYGGYVHTVYYIYGVRSETDKEYNKRIEEQKEYKKRMLERKKEEYEKLKKELEENKN